MVRTSSPAISPRAADRSSPPHAERVKQRCDSQLREEKDTAWQSPKSSSQADRASEKDDRFVVREVQGTATDRPVPIQLSSPSEASRGPLRHFPDANSDDRATREVTEFPCRTSAPGPANIGEESSDKGQPDDTNNRRRPWDIDDVVRAGQHPPKDVSGYSEQRDPSEALRFVMEDISDRSDGLKQASGRPGQPAKEAEEVRIVSNAADETLSSEQAGRVSHAVDELTAGISRHAEGREEAMDTPPETNVANDEKDCLEVEKLEEPRPWDTEDRGEAEDEQGLRGAEGVALQQEDLVLYRLCKVSSHLATMNTESPVKEALNLW